VSTVDMSVSIGGITFKNPVMSASGTFSEDFHQAIDFNRLGALVTKSVTPNPRMGNRGPRVAETTAGMINAVGIQSKGVDEFIKKSIPFYQKYNSPLIVSISADTVDDFVRLAEQLSIEGVDALEVNISCPNLEDNGKSYAMDPAQTYRVMTEVRKASSLPLFAKLTPNSSHISEIALAAEEAGSDGLVVANTILAMAINVETRKPKVGNVMGGLSGPAIKPIIVRMVYQVAQAVNIPIIGCGGICTAEDAIEYMVAGASVVQVGTYSFVNPTGMLEIIQGMEQYALRHGLSKITDVVGTVQIDKGLDVKKAEQQI
jgi:dihydroorotate dehydrogenase (NAD+) catalytic subunit